MKLKFKNQDFQTDAVNAVCDLFLGQEKRYSSFEISKNVSNLLLQNEFGIGNVKLISNDRILEIQKIYKYLFQSKMNVSQATRFIENEMPPTEERDEILEFIKNSPRGIVKGYGTGKE